MPNPIAACLIIIFSIIFATQLLLEYYVNDGDLTNGHTLSKCKPKYLSSNKIHKEEIQKYIFEQEDKMMKLYQEYWHNRQFINYHYNSLYKYHATQILRKQGKLEAPNDNPSLEIQNAFNSKMLHVTKNQEKYILNAKSVAK